MELPGDVDLAPKRVCGDLDLLPGRMDGPAIE